MTKQSLMMQQNPRIDESSLLLVFICSHSFHLGNIGILRLDFEQIARGLKREGLLCHYVLSQEDLG